MSQRIVYRFTLSSCGSKRDKTKDYAHTNLNFNYLKNLTIMNKIKLEAPFKAFRGKICKHSDIIYKKMKQTQYTSQICNPRTKPFSAEELARQTKFFAVDDSQCIGCGLCAKKCPVQAIAMQKTEKTETNKLGKHPIWTSERCALCLGCLHRCPKFAINYNNKTQTHGQYQHSKYFKE